MWYGLPVGIGVGVLLGGKSPTKALYLSGATLVGTAIVRSIGWRAAGSAAWFALQGVGAMSMQSFAGAVVGGAVVGTGVSYALFGKEGAKDAVKLYTGQVPILSLAPDSYLGTIAQAPARIAATTQWNRAVEGNAAGLPTGWNTNVAEGLQDQSDWRLENLRKSFS
jgi:hypothetical protein